MATFGQRLKMARKRMNMTQDELGERVGIQKSTISKYEKDKIQNISNDIITRFARALGVPEAELLGGLEATLFAFDLKVYEKEDGVVVVDEIQNLKVFYDHKTWKQLLEDNNFHKVWGDLAAQTISEKEKELSRYLEVLRERPECRMLFSIASDASKEDVEKAVKIIEALRN